MEIKINLIPDYRKEEILAANNLRLALEIGFALLFIFLLFFAFLLSLYNVLDMEMKSIISSKRPESYTEQYEKIKNYDQEFERINKDAGLIKNLEKDQLYWANMFQKFSDNASPQIEITSLATKERAVFLAGKAGNRDDLMAYKEKLEGEPCFQEINLPLSNLVSPQNIAFQMDLKIDDNCLKKR